MVYPHLLFVSSSNMQLRLFWSLVSHNVHKCSQCIASHFNTDFISFITSNIFSHVPTATLLALDTTFFNDTSNTPNHKVTIVRINEHYSLGHKAKSIPDYMPIWRTLLPPNAKLLSLILMTFYNGIKVSFQYNLQPSIIEFDATQVIIHLQSSTLSYAHIIYDCNLILHQLTNRSIMPSYREVNRVEHKIAKSTSTRNVMHEISIMEKLPLFFE